jgi:predicted enzyme involved in methoxymalonyl-ACP biosynthesis
MASLEDKYGSYGQLGLLLLERGPKVWTIKLLLLSCRVMSRGVNTVMLSNILSQAKAAGVQLCAELVSNDRNRMMNITYKFAGFREAGKTARGILLENDLPSIQPFPPYLTVDRASRSKQRNGYPS